MSEKDSTELSRRSVLQLSGMMAAGQAADDGCNFITRSLGLCESDDAQGGGGGGLFGSGEELLALLSRTDDPTDEEIGEGNVAVYIKHGVLYQKEYNGNPEEVGGGGGVSPLTRQEVSGFSESDISITHNQTAVSDGSIQLTTTEKTGSTVDRYNEGTTYGTSGKNGLIVNPNRDLVAIQGEESNGTSGTSKAYLVDHSTGEILDTSDVSSGSFEVRGTMKSGNEYRVLVDDDGGSYTIGEDQINGLDQEGNLTTTDLDVTNAWDEGSTTTEPRGVDLLTAIYKTGALTGDALIEWDNSLPPDVSEWGYIQHNRTLDGETVEVAVEDQDGNEIERFTDRIFPVEPISSETGLRARVYLDRSSPDKSPALDSITRSYRPV